jgi:hypothetical protein
MMPIPKLVESTTLGQMVLWKNLSVCLFELSHTCRGMYCKGVLLKVECSVEFLCCESYSDERAEFAMRKAACLPTCLYYEGIYVGGFGHDYKICRVFTYVPFRVEAFSAARG